jgi:hypothetical protein
VPAARRAGPLQIARFVIQGLACLLLGFWVITTPGCTCTKNQNVSTREELKKKLEEEKKEREKKKPDFEIGLFQTQPNDMSRMEPYFKPGHWTSATQEIWANNFDFNGELVTDPFQLDGMPFRLGTSRPAVLPKGQRKYLEMVFYVPPGRRGTNITVRLLPRNSSREVLRQSIPSRRMPAHQFNFVVLSDSAERYQFLTKHRGLEAVAPNSDSMDNKVAPYYRIQVPKIENRVPLPSHPLAWTSIAYVLWDGMEPDKLTPEQQDALLDWLHWGGQLIISGPGSLDRLENTFLHDYLPAHGQKDIEFTQSDLEAFSSFWTVWGQPLKLVKPWSGKLLAPAEGAEVLFSTRAGGGDPLVVDRPVGRGRIVVTAFRLGQREMSTTVWPSFDNFLNGCLLRRPGRTFRAASSLDENEIEVDWSNGSPRLDPELISAVRYFARDARANLAAFKSEKVEIDNTGGPADEERGGLLQNLNPFALLDPGVDNRPESINDGVAGWEDFSPCANLARQSLRNSAGIKIPDATFVLYVLGAYLVVIVPINWCVFRLLGRVEWAWIAAPIITVLFAFAVVRLAQLDIGFARARTEIAVVEMHGGYPRAHVSRYTALYTSLTTTYDMKFEDPGALIQPFPRFSRNDEGREMISGEASATVNYRREADQVTLEGFEVRSNSTGMLHSEHMLHMGGPITAQRLADGRFTVSNRTRYKLSGAALIRAVRTPDHESQLKTTEVAWVGDLDPGGQRTVELAPWPDGKPWFKDRDQSGMTAAGRHEDLLNVRMLVKLAESEPRLSPGGLRLVAWTDEPLPGMEIEPKATQLRFAAVLIAHLEHRFRGPIERDRNSKWQFIKQPLKDEDTPETEGGNVGEDSE